MRYFILHAHHEPRSFNGALTGTAREALTAAGHEVVVSDLYAMGFDPVSDRRNFTTVADGEYLKQQAEETYATEHQGFAPDVEAEIGKLESCDVWVLQFPLWWFGVPAIMKGWFDRVLAMGRIYGQGQWYEEGIGAGRRGVVSMTTGGPASMYGPAGLNPDMRQLLTPIHHGIFWFNGFQPVEPFITWAPARMAQADREQRLRDWAEHLLGVAQLPALPHLPTTEFDPKRGFVDASSRFMVQWRLIDGPPPDPADRASQQEAMTRLRAEGRLLDSWVATDRKRGGFVLRDASPAEARTRLESLPLAGRLSFDLVEVDVNM
jgi:NAD(P)H dehydrogenase (quinone)